MYIDEFNITKLDYKLCAAFAGCVYDKIDDKIYDMMKNAEKHIIDTVKPKAVYEIFSVDKIVTDEGKQYVSFKETDFVLKGKSICEHLIGTSKCVFLCVTLGAQADKIIRKAQVTDVAYAVILDAMAGVMVETVCDETEKIIKESLSTYDMTYRFGLGYGDLPIESEPEFLRIVNANALMGLAATESYLLTPCKSVACVIGLKQL